MNALTGGVPAAPLQDDFATPSNSSITLDLGTWSDGGCPMRAYVINYRKQQASNERGEWIQVQYNQAQDRVVVRLRVAFLVISSIFNRLKR